MLFTLPLFFLLLPFDFEGKIRIKKNDFSGSLGTANMGECESFLGLYWVGLKTLSPKFLFPLTFSCSRTDFLFLQIQINNFNPCHVTKHLFLPSFTNINLSFLLFRIFFSSVNSKNSLIQQTHQDKKILPKNKRINEKRFFLFLSVFLFFSSVEKAKKN